MGWLTSHEVNPENTSAPSAAEKLQFSRANVLKGLGIVHISHIKIDINININNIYIYI